MSETLSIPSRFNGPLESGNGGYCSGVLASFIEGPAEVTLRRPVPLDVPLGVSREHEGSVRLLDGEALVAEASSAPDFKLDMPAPVGLPEARPAAARYRGSSAGLFGRCFVCGLGREDALGVFAGAVEGRRLVASPWTPPAWTANGEGQVRPEFVWARLESWSAFCALARPDPAQPRSTVQAFVDHLNAVLNRTVTDSRLSLIPLHVYRAPPFA